MKRLDCDVLVVGGGAAGSRAGYEAKRAHPNLKVLLAVAGGFGSSGSTNLIASESLGINAPFDDMQDGDSPDLFYRDILETGAGLSNPVLARVVADEACARVNELRLWASISTGRTAALSSANFPGARRPVP
jgi:fumarate reductase (CoM/CoB) subunit A